ncbi:hypothetical protein Tco_0033949 [Tanacetum coccineum]
MKVVKEESKALGLLMIDDDLFICEVKISKLYYSPSVKQQMDDLDNGNLDVYERKLCYDDNEGIYAEAVIFVNKRLVRLMDVTIEQLLDLIYGDHRIVDRNIKQEIRGDDEEVRTDKELSDLEETHINKEDEIVEIFRIKTKIFDFKTPLQKAFNEFNYLLKIDMDLLNHDIPRFITYEEYKNAWIHEWNEDVPWVPEEHGWRMEYLMK